MRSFLGDKSKNGKKQLSIIINTSSKIYLFDVTVVKKKLMMNTEPWCPPEIENFPQVRI
jgi:hypothetical protein